MESPQAAKWKMTFPEELASLQKLKVYDCAYTYAPICRAQSIRMALVIAAQKDWEVLQLDVQTAFFITSSQKEVHVKTLLATVNRCY